VPEGLLDKHGNSRRDAFETLRDVQLVGRRQHDAVGLRRGEERRERAEERDARSVRKIDRARLWIDDRREHRPLAVRDFLDVAAADEAGARDRDGDLAHGIKDGTKRHRLAS